MPNLTKQELLDTPEFYSDYRLRWLMLPEQQFSGSSIELVILQPRPDGQVW